MAQSGKIKCPICGKYHAKVVYELERSTIELIKAGHPDWVESSGVCTKCVEYYNEIDEFVGPEDEEE